MPLWQVIVVVILQLAGAGLLLWLVFAKCGQREDGND